MIYPLNITSYILDQSGQVHHVHKGSAVTFQQGLAKIRITTVTFQQGLDNIKIIISVSI